METFSRYLTLILAVILVFLFPLQYIAQSQSETVDDVIDTQAGEFTDTARQQGYFTKGMYENLIYQMDQTGDLYDLGIEISHPVSGKEITERSVSEVIPQGSLIRTSTVKADNKSNISDTLTTANDALTSQRNGISLFATHTHTADCYAGHRHIATCETITGDMTKASNVTYTFYSEYTKHTYRNIEIRCSTCNTLIYRVSLMDYDTDNGNFYGSDNDYFYIQEWHFNSNGNVVSMMGPYSRYLFSYTALPGYYYFSNSSGSGYRKQDPSWSSWVSTFNTLCNYVNTALKNPSSGWNITGIINPFRGVLPIFPYLGCNVCGRGVMYNCGQTQDETPMCSQVVTSIAATNPSQTVYKGESIITTATATMLDGTSKTVNCSSNYNSSVAGTQIVTLTYSGLVGNAKTTGIRTSTLSVAVLENNIPASLSVIPSTYTVYNGSEPTYTVTLTYSNGTTKLLTAVQYIKSGWSSGPGSKSVAFSYTENAVTVTKSIHITVLPNLTRISVSPASQTIKRYANPTYSVTAYYEDGTSKILNNGYSTSSLNNKTLGTQAVILSYTENGITKNASALVTITKLTTTCPICGYAYELDENDIDQGCTSCFSKVSKILISPTSVTIEQNKVLPITVTAVYQNGKIAVVTGWTSDYASNIIGIRQVKIGYQGVFAYITVETLPRKVTCPICYRPYRLNNDGTDPGCQMCNREVVGIKVAEETITIEKHQPLPITVTASFKDGHTAVITDWTVNFVADTAGTFDVTIYYKSVCDHITVKVIDEGSMSCPICNCEYDRTESPEGCPICSKTLVCIEAYLRNGGSKVMYNSQLNLKIVLIYRDNHRRLIFSGYNVSEYHPDEIGIQLVTVYYDNFSTKLSLEVITGPAKVICPNGHEYYLNEDGSDPGCPYCDDTDKDTAIFYFETTYTSEILQVLYTDGIYYLTQGDYLTVTISPREVSIRSKLKAMFFKTNVGISRKKYTFGGEVL